ncbi:uncharacterized protein LOC117120352 [Anneissia japonica]|uniref:uncharacterized protein LOC117120352 n=1 Tax=Anneissia japonica TaxID=1529436 RepID=UPI0014259A1C|nr:uncharacterized protein LOC117120352 [Anneissia japonica]
MSALGSLELLAAGFSASFGVEVLPPGAAASRSLDTPHKLTIHDLFHISHAMVPREIPETTLSGEIEVNIRSMIGTTSVVRIKPDQKISVMKRQMSRNPENLKFIFDRRPLKDEKTVEMEGIRNGGTVYMIDLTKDGKSGFYEMDTSLLARQFDYDFTNKRDGNDVYMRGEYRYYRPCGWYRYAVAVTDVYRDNNWLGKHGIRKTTTTGEWPVSYHGTKMRDKDAVIRKFRKGHANEYIRGVYSSPSLAIIDEFYAQIFEFKGKKYKIALQNRINPDQGGARMKIIPANQTEVGAEYWVSPMENQSEKVFDVRPYGIIIKQIDVQEDNSTSKRSCIIL